MAGTVKIDYANDCWWVKLYGGDGKIVDVYQVETGELTLTIGAYRKLLFIGGRDEELHHAGGCP